MEEQRQLTNAPLTMMELIEAIHKQKKKKSKTSGPDGILAKYYHKIDDILTDKLKVLFFEMLGQLHGDTRLLL